MGALIKQIACAGNREGAQGIQLLTAAMEAHVYDETVCRETAALFCSLTKVQSNLSALMSFAATQCMKALELHQNDTATADAIAALLALLPLEDDEQWSQGTDAS